MEQKSLTHTPQEVKRKVSLKVRIVLLNLVSNIMLFALLLAFRERLVLQLFSGLLCLFASGLLVYFNSSIITGPVTVISRRLAAMASRCDFSSETPYFKTGDEMEDLSGAVRQLQSVFQRHTEDLVRVLNELADYNLNLSTHCDYPGDYLPHKEAVAKIIDRLNEIIHSLSNSIGCISITSAQVAEGAQEVSKGSTAQLHAAQRLTEQIKAIYRQVETNARLAAEAGSNAISAGHKMEKGEQEMEKLREAMRIINDTSEKVAEVVKTIDSISMQTTILSLNASIEAARAGEAGKGFSVVAEEVRALASKTSEASVGTAELVQEALNAVHKGLAATDNTAAVMEDVMEEAKGAAQMLTVIADAAKEQADSVKAITENITDIRSVIERNYAAAQEGFAASEEAAGQAQIMESIIGRFRLQKSF